MLGSHYSFPIIDLKYIQAKNVTKNQKRHDLTLNVAKNGSVSFLKRRKLLAYSNPGKRLPQ